VELTEEIMYQALIDKDSTFEGIFIAAVRTTGIFCRPTCTAKKPKKENVEFFPNTHAAIVHGYRPCKICNPLHAAGETPMYIQKLLEQIEENNGNTITDYNLRETGVDPNTIRRWFQKQHGMTFHAYQRMLRINSAFKQLKQAKKVVPVAFDSGYESLSGFNDSFKNILGFTPKESRNKSIVNYCRLDTPIGPMITCSFEERICLLEFTDRKMLETEFKDISKRLNASILPGECKVITLLKSQLKEYFEGKRKFFSIPLHPVGTDFQISVWEELLRIPYGSTRSYKQQSLALNNLKAIRAVAQANGMNKISILIPCHRVIGEDGHLTGYGGGLWRKKWLLNLENGALGENETKGQQALLFSFK
jgi:AraC family transcriptional regulator of adaptative response/methylated-DNA-[protein]-cysteine methyltransferase